MHPVPEADRISHADPKNVPAPGKRFGYRGEVPDMLSAQRACSPGLPEETAAPFPAPMYETDGKGNRCIAWLSDGTVEAAVSAETPAGISCKLWRKASDEAWLLPVCG